MIRVTEDRAAQVRTADRSMVDARVESDGGIESGGCMGVRIVLVADGDPYDVQTNSGVARGLALALEKQPNVQIVGAIDSRPRRGLLTVLNIALSFRLSRDRWRNQLNKGWLATWLRSRARDRGLRGLDSEDFDIVMHVRNTYLPAGTPYVCFVDGTSSMSQENWASWRLGPIASRNRLRLEKQQFERAHVVLTAGRHVANEIERTYGIPPDRVFAVGGGTNFSTTLGDVAARQTDTPTKNVLFVAKDFERKGGHVLLEAMRHVRNAHPDAILTIVGPPQPMVREHGTEWIGRVSERDEMARLYQRADLFVLPSLHEPYGLAVQEALHFGLPCVVSDTGALPELVGNGRAGIVVRAGSAEELADALTLLLGSPERRRELSGESARVLSDMTWENVAQRSLQAIAQHDVRRADSKAGLE